MSSQAGDGPPPRKVLYYMAEQIPASSTGARRVTEAGVGEDRSDVQPSHIQPVDRPPEGARIATTPVEFTPSHCQGVTIADGAACRARPLKDGPLCVGHTRQAQLRA